MGLLVVKLKSSLRKVFGRQHGLVRATKFPDGSCFICRGHNHVVLSSYMTCHRTWLLVHDLSPYMTCHRTWRVTVHDSSYMTCHRTGLLVHDLLPYMTPRTWLITVHDLSPRFPYMSNLTGATNWTRVLPIRSYHVTQEFCGFHGVSCCSIFSFPCTVLWTFFLSI
jgi:hypothetical protein